MTQAPADRPITHLHVALSPKWTTGKRSPERRHLHFVLKGTVKKLGWNREGSHLRQNSSTFKRRNAHVIVSHIIYCISQSREKVSSSPLSWLLPSCLPLDFRAMQAGGYNKPFVSPKTQFPAQQKNLPLLQQVDY